jgi:tetraacyldisaccharide 4'-kinase
VAGIERHWYRDTLLSRLLAPLGWLYGLLAILRRALYRRRILRSHHPGAPVIVVGNLTVGGSGKTPLVIWLAQFLKKQGRRPGIVTRGYGGAGRDWPQTVTPASDPDAVGDEPVLLARTAGCPVVADPDRARGARRLVQTLGCDIVVSDDGLQHYRLARDLEIAVIDGARRFGNGRCLPAGPLREPQSRLSETDARVTLGVPQTGEWGMALATGAFHRLAAPEVTTAAGRFRDRPVHALAGIGHPARFFDQLRGLGLRVIEHPFPDHHRFRVEELQFQDGGEVIMTQKDAVKCERLAGVTGWYLTVAAEPDRALGEFLQRWLQEHGGG